MTTSHSLLVAASQGSNEAWEKMCVIYTPFIRRWLARFSLSNEAVQDLCQDVLATLVRQLPNFEHRGNPGSFRAWLRLIATNQARLYWRRSASREVVGGTRFAHVLEQLEDPHSDLTEEWNREHQQHVLQVLLAELSEEFEPKTMEIFRRLIVSGEPVAEVASALSVPVGSIYVAKSRVLRRLRERGGELLE